MAISAVQRHLQLGAEVVEVGPYLTALCESLESSMAGEGRATTLTVRADAASVGSREATSLGLIVAELVINALKHAFPDGRDGAVLVAYDVGEAGWTLSVTDNGVGRPPPSPQDRVGLGTDVIKSLTRQLQARVEIGDAQPGSRTMIISNPPAAPSGAAQPVG